MHYNIMDTISTGIVDILSMFLIHTVTKMQQNTKEIK